MYALSEKSLELCDCLQINRIATLIRQRGSDAVGKKGNLKESLEDSEKSRQLAVGSSPSGKYKQSNSTTVDDGARSPADAEVVAAMSSTFSTKMGVFNSHSCEGDG